MGWATSVVNFACIVMLHDTRFLILMYFQGFLNLYDFFDELHKWYCRRMLSLCMNVLWCES